MGRRHPPSPLVTPPWAAQNPLKRITDVLFLPPPFIPPPIFLSLHPGRSALQAKYTVSDFPSYILIRFESCLVRFEKASQEACDLSERMSAITMIHGKINRILCGRNCPSHNALPILSFQSIFLRMGKCCPPETCLLTFYLFSFECSEYRWSSCSLGAVGDGSRKQLTSRSAPRK